MARLFMILSVLFDYPDEYLKDHLGEIDALFDGDRDIPPAEREEIRKVTRWMRETDLLALQQHYVQTFDLTQEHSLHLTHHLYGESRDRGPALVDLTEHYRAHGFEVVAGELPDYLPLVLEYVNTFDPLAARMFLHDVVDVLKLLADNLERAGSPYAPLARVIEQRGRLGAIESIETAGAPVPARAAMTEGAKP
jgi:nitrate reductase delta subunit